MQKGREWIKRKIFLLEIVLVVVLCGCAHTHSSIEQQITEQIELGNRYLTEGNYEEAIIAFQKAIELEPKNTDVYIQLADLYMTVGDRELASENYTAAYQNGTENGKEGVIQKLLQLAEAALEEDNNKFANFYYELILELNKDVSEAFLGKVNLLIEEEQFDQAYAILKEKAEEVPEDTDTLIAEKLAEFDAGKIKDYKGRIIKEIWFNEDGTLRSYTVSSYDDSENKTIIRYYNADDTLSSAETVYRDESGERIKSARYAGEGYLMTEGSRQENGRWRDIAYNSDGSINYIEESSEDGTWTYDANGNLTQYSLRERNEQGQVVRWSHYAADGTLLSYYISEYNANGERITYTRYNADGTVEAYLQTE